MSELIDDGGSAFPFGKKNFTDDWSRGMTLRDWFAGQATKSDITFYLSNNPGIHPTTARFMFADDMLAARKENQ